MRLVIRAPGESSSNFPCSLLIWLQRSSTERHTGGLFSTRCRIQLSQTTGVPSVMSFFARHSAGLEAFHVSSGYSTRISALSKHVSASTLGDCDNIVVLLGCMYRCLQVLSYLTSLDVDLLNHSGIGQADVGDLDTLPLPV